MNNNTNYPTKWILTDPDSFQLRRKIEDRQYEFYQITAIVVNEEDRYAVSHDVIYLADYDENDILSMYGYKSMDELHDIYDDEAEAILAECCFETDAESMQNTIQKHGVMNWDETKEKIIELSGYVPD